MVTDFWSEGFDLDTPAARALKALIATLPKNRPLTINLFGSSPLQIAVDQSLLSADVDVFCDDEDLTSCVREAGLDRDQSDFYIQVCSALNFRTSPRWLARAKTIQLGHCIVRIPHPIDILIAKLNRLDEKDLEAFRRVIAKTGHPTEAELIRELQLAVDLFRPAFDEEAGHDMTGNCRRLWPIIFGREMDPRAEIIAPALAERKRGYGEPPQDWKAVLREAAGSYGKK